MCDSLVDVIQCLLQDSGSHVLLFLILIQHLQQYLSETNSQRSSVISTEHTSCQQPTEISTEVSYLPAVQPRHNPWGKALQTLCTLWLCCQGCHTLGQKHAWKFSNHLKHTRPSAENNYSSISNCSAWAGIQLDHESSVKALSLAFLGGSEVMLVLHLSKSRARMWSAHFLHFHQGSSGLSSSSTWRASCKATHTSTLEDYRDKTEHCILLKSMQN